MILWEKSSPLCWQSLNTQLRFCVASGGADILCCCKSLLILHRKLNKQMLKKTKVSFKKNGRHYLTRLYFISTKMLSANFRWKIVGFFVKSWIFWEITTCCTRRMQSSTTFWGRVPLLLRDVIIGPSKVPQNCGIYNNDYMAYHGGEFSSDMIKERRLFCHGPRALMFLVCMKPRRRAPITGHVFCLVVACIGGAATVVLFFLK